MELGRATAVDRAVDDGRVEAEQEAAERGHRGQQQRATGVVLLLCLGLVDRHRVLHDSGRGVRHPDDKQTPYHGRPERLPERHAARPAHPTGRGRVSPRDVPWRSPGRWPCRWPPPARPWSSSSGRGRPVSRATSCRCFFEAWASTPTAVSALLPRPPSARSSEGPLRSLGRQWSPTFSCVCLSADRRPGGPAPRRRTPPRRSHGPWRRSAAPWGRTARSSRQLVLAGPPPLLVLGMVPAPSVVRSAHAQRRRAPPAGPTRRGGITNRGARQPAGRS